MLRGIHTLSKIMSPNGDTSGRVMGLPIWNGRSQDPMEWDNYRYKIQGYCAAKGVAAMLKKSVKVP